MKKLMILLALMAALTFALTACGGGETEEDIPLSTMEEETTDDTQDVEDPAEEETEEPAEGEESEEPAQEEKPSESKPQENKPAQKPSENKPSQSTPEQKPAEPAPEQQPSAPAASVGATLKADFQSHASGSALSIAEHIVSNQIIPFGPMTMPVEPGLLNGFGNAEITGFSEGAMFGPMIGTIPFIGYVFTLDGTVDANTFVSNLTANANLRWNVCTEADEMVTAVSGDKVFFLMCPSTFDEEM